jgi:hypothetical protein
MRSISQPADHLDKLFRAPRIKLRITRSRYGFGVLA